MSKVSMQPGPCILPTPVALIGTMVEGKANFMPAASLGVMDYEPQKGDIHETCR